MARPVAALERFIERIVELPIGRLFRAPVEPVRLARRVELAMEEGRRSAAHGTVAPDRFRVLLDASDLAGLLHDDDALEASLAEAVRSRARARGWTLLDRPHVTLHPSEAVRRGDIVVTATISPRDASEGTGRVAASDGQPALEATAILPATPVVLAALVIRASGRPERRVHVPPTPMRVGRADDNDLVLRDERVSRYHGVLAVAQGMLVYRDLASANGSFLHGQRVDEVVLGTGDVLVLGGTSLRVEAP